MPPHADRGDDALPTVSVVIPTHRREDALRQTLQALLDVDYPAKCLEVIVVDDGSDKATRHVVDAFRDRSVPVRDVAQPHHGVARARNNGSRQARGEVILFLDDDIVVGSDHIRRHVAIHRRYAECLVNGEWEFTGDLQRELQTSPFGRFRLRVEEEVKRSNAKHPFDEGLTRPETLDGKNLSVPAATFRRIGGFDERFPFAGAGDYEFSVRAREAGYLFICDPQIQIEHNDRRLTLADFGERYRRGAHTTVVLAELHPTERQRPLLVRNAPPHRGDSFGRVAAVLLKHALSTQAMLHAAHGCVRALERFAPESRVLQRLYWTVMGLYIYRGAREGRRAVREGIPAKAGR
jgi:GT2 family glycosyltransferase